MIDYIDNENLAKIIVKTLSKGCPEVGRLYPGYLKEVTSNKQFLVYKVNDILVAFASYSIKKRLRKVDLDYIFVDYPKRREHIASTLIKQIYYDTESLFINLGYTMRIKTNLDYECNKFFRKISSDVTYEKSISDVNGFTIERCEYLILPNKLKSLKLR